MKKNIISFFLFCLLATIGCSNDDENLFNASEQDLTDFFSEEVVEALAILNFTINKGSNPPEFEGDFFASPMILVNSNVPTDNLGDEFVDLEFTFSNLNDDQNTIDFNGVSLLGEEVVEVFSGDGSSFISGNDNNFSVFSIIVGEVTATGSFFEFAYALSGTITDIGIEDLELAIIMLDDQGDPFNQLIENGEGRRFIDEDRLSEFATENRSLIQNILLKSILSK